MAGTISSTHSSMQVAIEVDGPYHFTVNTQQPLGNTLIRRARMLSLLLCVEGPCKEDSRSSWESRPMGCFHHPARPVLSIMGEKGLPRQCPCITGVSLASELHAGNVMPSMTQRFWQ